MEHTLTKVRIDKWLWAARFFKTRSLAKQAVDSGKVRMDKDRVKASKEITCGTMLRIRQGWEEKTVEVLALSDQRRGAPEAQALYRETDESIAQREARASERKVFGATAKTPSKPTTKERRQLNRIKREILDDEQKQEYE